MYSTGASVNNRRREERRKRKVLLYFFLGIFSASGILAGLWCVPRFPQVAIKNIEVSGNNFVSKEDVIEKVETTISGTKLVFFPKNVVFWYPKDEIQQRILDSNLRILTASVKESKFNILKVSITERDPVALLCGGSAPEQFTEPCFFLDKTGFPYAATPKFSSSLYVTFTNGTTSDSNLGKRNIEEEFFNTLFSFSETLRKSGFRVRAINIFSDHQEVYLDNGGKLIINADSDLSKAFANFKTLVNDPNFKSKLRSTEPKFNYIDLRFGNKIFYKI